MESRTAMELDTDLNLKATELRLGLPGSDETSTTTSSPTITLLTTTSNNNNKRSSPEASSVDESRSETNSSASNVDDGDRDSIPPPAKAQVVGWPPIRSYRKSCLQQKKSESSSSAGMYVKVSMDGAAYLRKIDVKMYKSYDELLTGLENMFKLRFGEYSEREGYNGSDFAPTYQDKDGDWMLVGDVPWEMFIGSCKRLRIMRGSEARGLACL